MNTDKLSSETIPEPNRNISVNPVLQWLKNAEPTMPWSEPPASFRWSETLKEKKMKNPILLCLTIFGLCSSLLADTVSLTLDGNDAVNLSQPQTDFVRENLIHIFDSANFHLMQGGALTARSEEQILKQLEEVKSGSWIELDLDEPCRIVVEGRELKAKRMWVSVRESDGFVYDWILEQPSGDLVALGKPRGELIVQFAPYVLNLIKPKSEQ